MIVKKWRVNMKIFLYLISLIMAFVSICSSCSQEINIVVDNPTLEVSSKEVRNGEELTLNLIPGEKTNVNFNVTFYFNDEEIGTVSDLPYRITYKIKDKTLGIHSLSYKASYKNKSGGSTSSASITGFVLIEITE